MSTHVQKVDGLMEAIRAISDPGERLRQISEFIDSYSDQITLHNYVIPDLLRINKQECLWEEAIHVARKARSLYPDRTKWYDIEVQICEFENAGNKEAALDATLEQLTLRGDSSGTYHWLGDRFAEIGLHDRAWPIYTRAIELAALEMHSPHLIRVSMVKLLIKETRFPEAVALTITGICEAEKLNKSGAPKSMISLLRRTLKGAGFERKGLAQQIAAKCKSGGTLAAQSVLESERNTEQLARANAATTQKHPLSISAAPLSSQPSHRNPIAGKDNRMEKDALLKSIQSWEEQLPTPYAFRKLMTVYRRLGKIEKKEKNYEPALDYFNRLLSLSMIWHAVFGPKTSGISGWQVDDAEGYLKKLHGKFGTIYPYCYSDHGAIDNDVILSQTDYKNIVSLSEVAAIPPQDESDSVASTTLSVPSESVELQLREDIIVGRRVDFKKKGKAKYAIDSSQEGTVEQYALSYYRESGLSGVWSENDYWWQLFAYLYWDVIFAKISGVYDPRFGSFPGLMQDMPRDLFQSDFYNRRKRLFTRRDRDLVKKGVVSSGASRLMANLASSYKRHQNAPCRLIEKSRRFKLKDLQLAARFLSPNQFLLVMRRLYVDFNENRSGLPDLFLIKANAPSFVEVKREGERIAPNQKRWMEYLHSRVGIQVMICRVKDE